LYKERFGTENPSNIQATFRMRVVCESAAF